MSKGFAFWLIWLVSFILCGVIYAPEWNNNPRFGGVTAIVFILMGILGWAVFGPPIQ
jgi:hypothetical protein